MPSVRRPPPEPAPRQVVDQCQCPGRVAHLREHGRRLGLVQVVQEQRAGDDVVPDRDRLGQQVELEERHVGLLPGGGLPGVLDRQRAEVAAGHLQGDALAAGRAATAGPARRRHRWRCPARGPGACRRRRRRSRHRSRIGGQRMSELAEMRLMRAMASSAWWCAPASTSGRSMISGLQVPLAEARRGHADGLRAGWRRGAGPGTTGRHGQTIAAGQARSNRPLGSAGTDRRPLFRPGRAIGSRDDSGPRSVTKRRGPVESILPVLAGRACRRGRFCRPGRPVPPGPRSKRTDDPLRPEEPDVPPLARRRLTARLPRRPARRHRPGHPTPVDGPAQPARRRLGGRVPGGHRVRRPVPAGGHVHPGARRGLLHRQPRAADPGVQLRPASRPPGGHADRPEDHWWGRGNYECLFDLTGAAITSTYGHFFAGPSFYVRANWLEPGCPVVPYIQLGTGAVLHRRPRGPVAARHRAGDRVLPAPRGGG